MLNAVVCSGWRHAFNIEVTYYATKPGCRDLSTTCAHNIYIYIYIYVYSRTLSSLPHGYRRRGRPKRTWGRTIEDEIRSTRRSWNEVKGIAGDRNAWKLFMDALCSTRSKRS